MARKEVKHRGPADL